MYLENNFLVSLQLFLRSGLRFDLQIGLLGLKRLQKKLYALEVPPRRLLGYSFLLIFGVKVLLDDFVNFVDVVNVLGEVRLVNLMDE